MKVYKLFRQTKDGNLHPMFVGSKEVTPIGIWLPAKVGEKTADNRKVKSKLGGLAVRPGWHCCELPFAGHIGKRQSDGSLYQSADTVWAEVEIPDKEVTAEVVAANPKTKDSKVLVDGWYWFKPNKAAKVRWLISSVIKVLRILSNEEVASICREHGIEPQPIA